MQQQRLKEFFFLYTNKQKKEKVNEKNVKYQIEMPEKGIKCMQSQMTTSENIRLNEKNLSGKDSAKKFLLQPNICYLVNKSLIRTANEEQWKLG